MIRTIAMLVLVGSAVPCEAGSCRVKARAVAVQATSGLAVVPFAVPVGMPVAPLGTVSYGYAAVGTAGQASSGTPGPCHCCQCRAGEPAPTPAVPQPAGPEPIEGASVEPAEHPGLTVLQDRCAKCHTGAASKGGVLLFGEGGEWFAGAPRRAIFAAIRDGKMPKAGEPLSPEEFTSVVDWLLESEEPPAAE